MGIIVKEIKSTKIVSYVGFSPDPEEKAHNRIWKWAVDNGYGDLYGNKNLKPFRNFGHDTDENGRCFEEKLEPSSPELLRLDLYIEIEKV